MAAMARAKRSLLGDGIITSGLEVTVQPCLKIVVHVIARSVLCDEAIPKWSM
jgi:hypothetical protein